MPWGYHLILDCADCDSSIDDKEVIERFAVDLVKRIDMIAYGDPIIEYFGTDNKSGYSLVQLITTSSITAHFASEVKEIYLDVFSCKPFDANIVQDCVKYYFGAKYINATYLERNAPSNENKESEEY